MGVIIYSLKFIMYLNEDPLCVGKMKLILFRYVFVSDNNQKQF